MTTAPRVEACIDAVMAKYPRTGPVSQAKYYEEVHQHLGPLARQLEHEVQELRTVVQNTMALGLITEDQPLLLARAKAALGETN